MRRTLGADYIEFKAILLKNGCAVRANILQTRARPRTLACAAGYSSSARPQSHACMGAADDDATRIVAVTLENVTLAVALLGDLERAHRSGNSKTIAKVRRRLDRVLDAVAARR